MRQTLRRSCDACAKSKLGCDLRTPRCSRCMKKDNFCVYANQPLTLSPDELPATPTKDFIGFEGHGAQLTRSHSQLVNQPIGGSFDPFDSYPRTRLARTHVERLIQHFLSNIAFQYYPLDLDASSNPFVVSWWPLALADPALFHVSLQTASLDIDLRAQNGFTNSEVLMSDSVSLVRKRVADPLLASQDETMDSVVTLAAIEFGKSNTAIGAMHIDGIKKIVQLRGGLQQIKLTSALTARMIPWVTMILMQAPQFSTQDDSGHGVGIAPITQWVEAEDALSELALPGLEHLHLDSVAGGTLRRLRKIFYNPENPHLTTTELHDLTCFVLHRMLGQPASLTLSGDTQSSSISTCIRHAIALYMLAVHGPTYFSHARLQYDLVLHLKNYLSGSIASLLISHESLALWLLSTGMVASESELELCWFIEQSTLAAQNLQISTWEHVESHLHAILWYKSQHMAKLFRHRWAVIWARDTT